MPSPDLKDGTRKSLERDFEEAAEEDATQADSPVPHHHSHQHHHRIPLEGSLPPDLEDDLEPTDIANNDF